MIDRRLVQNRSIALLEVFINPLRSKDGRKIHFNNNNNAIFKLGTSLTP